MLLLLVALEGVRLFTEPIVPVYINAGTMITGEGQEPYLAITLGDSSTVGNGNVDEQTFTPSWKGSCRSNF